jgi:hypothetical protein
MDADPASGVTVFAALAAGFVSFLSPCVLPLVPGYLSAVTGVASSDIERASRTRSRPSFIWKKLGSVRLHHRRRENPFVVGTIGQRLHPTSHGTASWKGLRSWDGWRVRSGQVKHTCCPRFLSTSGIPKRPLNF